MSRESVKSQKIMKKSKQKENFIMKSATVLKADAKTTTSKISMTQK
jgi:hypothetical protein